MRKRGKRFSSLESKLQRPWQGARKGPKTWANTDQETLGKGERAGRGRVPLEKSHFSRGFPTGGRTLGR